MLTGQNGGEFRRCDGVVSENSITTEIAEVQSVAGSAGSRFRAVVPGAESAAFPDGSDENAPLDDGGLDEPSTTGRDRLSAGGDQDIEGESLSSRVISG